MYKVDEDCPNLVRAAFTELYQLAAQPGGRAQASQLLGLCTPFGNDDASLR